MSGVEVDMPPVDADYLLAYLAEAGPVMADGPLTAQEISAWMQQTGVELEPWEFRLLLRLSREYMSQMEKAKRPDCPPPWGAYRAHYVNRKLDSFLD